jgi:hypothetical protein
LDGEHRAVAILRQIPSDSRTELDAEALLALVKRQHGTVSRRQLRQHGLSGTMIARWLQARRLHRIHHHVYAVGRPCRWRAVSGPPFCTPARERF